MECNHTYTTKSFDKIFERDVTPVRKQRCSEYNNIKYKGEGIPVPEACHEGICFQDDFISIASHELKTPLTTAKAYIQLIEFGMEQKNNPDILYAKKAANSIESLNRLIMELLDISKIKNGKIGLNISSFDFNKMLAEAIESVQIVSEKHMIIKNGEIAGKVSGDEDRLKQVVINLFTNAVKYSPGADKVFINVALENNTVKVAVKDHGIGINKKSLNKIFDRYYRENGQSSHIQGLGIGLAISKEIMQRHNGKIWAESEPGKGSTVYFTLPA